MLVGSPLNGAQVNAFFVHVPQGAEVAQFGHVGFDGVNGVVNFGFGGPTAHGHSQATVSQFVAAAQGAQHIARFKTGRGTSRARRHSQTFDSHDERLTFNIVETHVDVVGHTLCGVAV